MSIDRVSIQFRPGAYGIFRNLQNKVWFALGEFVDNALQSYIDNKSDLKVINKKYQFKVEIDFDWENDILTIRDNAGGINTKTFPRAFEPANIPVDNTGLHEFGMGMKTAAIWLADIWTLKTAALGENIVRTVTFDLNKVLEENREVLNVHINKKKHIDDHFTELTLKVLSRNSASPYQMAKVKSHLTSIYRQYLKNGEMLIVLNQEDLYYTDPPILNAPYYAEATTGKSILWKREVDVQHGRFRAKGYVALLEELSSTEHNGFSLFRRGRVIEGSHDEKYRPKSLSGQVGSFRYKRIFGELELFGFNVSFNKGSFQEQADLELLIENIKKELAKGKFNFLKQADEFRKSKTPNDNKIIAKKIASTLKKEKEINFKRIKTSIEQIENGSLKASEKAASKIKAIGSINDEFQVKNTTYTIRIDIINDATIKTLYTLQLDEKELYSSTAVCKLNLNHPFFIRYEMFKKEEDYQPIVQIVRSLIIAELMAPDQGTKNAGNIRTNFNNLIKNV